MKKELSVNDLNRLSKGTLMESLGIEYLAAEEGLVKARMPVDHRTLQPFKILHGGAYCSLAETAGSTGSYLMVDAEKFQVRGSTLIANHVGAAVKGYVYAEARIVHKGRTTHLWNIDITDEDGRLLSTCRLTNFIIPKP
jgi:uncharacterized protein (TIGR00369 family)